MNLLHKKQQSKVVPRRRLNTDNDRLPSSNTFKRNRTFIGTTSSKLDSVKIGINVESSRTHVHNLASKRRKALSIFIVSVLSAIFLWTLISNFTATVVISNSNTSILKPINDPKYSKVIQEYFEMNPLSRFRFFLNQEALSSYVSSQISEVEAVSLKDMAGIGMTNVDVKMRTPVAGWKIDNKQYYVDSKGVPFEQNYFADPIVQIVDNSGATLQTGSASVSKRFLGFVGLIVSLAQQSGYTVTEAILPANTTRELEIKLKDINLLVKLSIDRSAGEQVEDMSRAIKYFVSNNRMPSYIDIRVSGKAFFK